MTGFVKRYIFHRRKFTYCLKLEAFTTNYFTNNYLSAIFCKDSQIIKQHFKVQRKVVAVSFLPFYLPVCKIREKIPFHKLGHILSAPYYHKIISNFITFTGCHSSDNCDALLDGTVSTMMQYCSSGERCFFRWSYHLLLQ